MLSEKVLFALNNTDDSFLEEAWELLLQFIYLQKETQNQLF